MATKYVDGTNGNDSNNGDASATAYATIARAISQISSGTSVGSKNTIIVHSGTYAEGPLDGSSKDFISLTTAGDGLVSIKHDGTNTSGNNTLELGESWDLTGNGLDLAIFTKQFDGGSTANHDTDCFAVKVGTHGDSHVPFTASSVAFVGQKYLRGTVHTNESFGDALDIRPYGTASNCVFMHLTTVGGSRNTAKLSLVGSLIFNTGTTSSAPNGVYSPNASHSNMINNTFSHCTGSPGLVYYAPKKMMNNLFLNCASFGTQGGGGTTNYFLREADTTTLGNAIGASAGPTVLSVTTVTTEPTVWKDSSNPSGQFTSEATNTTLMPTGSSEFVFSVGREPGDELLVTPNKCYSEDGIFPGQAYKNSIFYALPVTASVLPHGGKSLNFDDGKRSTLISAGNIAGRSIASTGPATDILGNAWIDPANPPIGCFSQYVLYAKEPEAGQDKPVREVQLGKGNSITLVAIDEDRKTSFRNVDATTLNRPSNTTAGLRGRHTIYKVTTTKS